MKKNSTFHIVTVGWDHRLITNLADQIEAKSQYRFSHIVHPGYAPQDWPDHPLRPDLFFFRSDLKQLMPAADPRLLASLEQDGTPTIHNMIMGDRIVSKLQYDEALKYATFLAQRMAELFREIRPSAVIGGFDALHGCLAPAVAKRLGIPWFALNFSVMPPGMACFCDRLTPAARIVIRPKPISELRLMAETLLKQFEDKKIQAPAYIAPPPLSFAGRIAKLPSRFAAVLRTVRKARLREFIMFTEERPSYSVAAALRHLWRATSARRALVRTRAVTEPPSTPYVMFGLHMQPESSIDVWAPYFSNQMWVIELIARSIPPTHKLLVKIHKSDISNYSRAQLQTMQSFPGVDLVAPFADTRRLIENADLVVAIQGTMGLEAALLGKPVIMLCDSPAEVFPSVSRLGAITDFPGLVNRKLAESHPGRSLIVDAYATYLAPFSPASTNNWGVIPTDEQIGGYVGLLGMLEQYVSDKGAGKGDLASTNSRAARAQAASRLDRGATF